MSSGDSSRLQTLLIGLDGACLPVLEPLADEGVTPNLQSLFDRSAVGPLESQLPPWTPSAWPSLYTGVNPGKHGVFDFLRFDGYEWDVVTRNDVTEYSLWELLDREGLSSVVVNVPVTYPAPSFEGALIPGYVGPEEPPCHPEGLLDEVRAEIGAYRVYKPMDLTDEQLLTWYERLARMRGEAFTYLVERFDPEFGFLQFQQTDSVCHERPGDQEAMRTVYRAVDEQVGAVLDRFDPETVMVVSDHGIGAYDGVEFRVNEFLRRQGYLTTVHGGEGMPSWASISRKHIREGRAGGRRERSPLERLFSTTARFGLTSQTMGSLLARVGLSELVLRHVPSDAVRAATEQVDFAESIAYMRSRTELGVRINLAGRDPSGSVSPAEYESVRDDLVEALRAVRTPEGDPVFEAVVPADDVFDGPHVREGVDILTVPSEFDHYLSAAIRSSQFGPLTEPWNHKRDGVIAVAGVDAGSASTLSGAHLFDVAPTVLSTLGVHPSSRMDGETLPVTAPRSAKEYPPFTPAETDAELDQQIEQRLANLGYLDTNHEY